jgi:hypothetical protein
MRERIRLGALLVAVAVVSAACGGGGKGSIELGIKRVALSLSFSEEELAVAVPPNIITRIVPTTPEAIIAAPSTPFTPPDLRSLLPECDTAPEGAPPAEAVARTITSPPQIGRYLRHNEGTITINGALPITLPYPPFSAWEVPSIEELDRPAADGVPFIVDPVPAGTDYVVDVKKVIIPGFEITDRIQVGATDIKLLQRTSVSGEDTTTFTPDPPVTLYTFGTEGTAWRSAGLDTESGTSMFLQGEIVSREVIDVCGTPIDTYRVEVTEQLVNLTTGDISGTPPGGEPSYYNYAPQFGALALREDVLSQITTRDPATGVPVQATLDYISTANSTEPSEPLS